MALSFTESPILHIKVFFYLPFVCHVCCFYFMNKLKLEADFLRMHPSLALTSWLALTIYLTFLGFDFTMSKMEIIVHLGLNEVLHVVLRVEPDSK